MNSKSIQQFFNHPSINLASRLINERSIRVGITELDENMLNTERSEEKYEDLLVSLVEYIWIKIIEQINHYPAPNKLLIKANCFHTIQNSNNSILEFYLIRTILYREQLYLLTTTDGKIHFFTIAQHPQLSRKLFSQNFDVFSLTQLIGTLYTLESDDSSIFNSETGISIKDLELLLLIKQYGFTQLNIAKKDGKINYIDIKQELNSDKRIADILQNGDFQNIDLKQRNGKIVGINLTMRKKWT